MYHPNMRVSDRTAGEGMENNYVRHLIQIGKHWLKNQNGYLLLLGHEFRRDGHPLPDDTFLGALIKEQLGCREVFHSTQVLRAT